MAQLSQKRQSSVAIDGEWRENIDGFDDFKVKLRSFNCRDSERYQDALYTRILGRKRKGKPPIEVRDYVQAKALIEICT